VLNEDALARALAAAGLSAPVRWDDVTGSTNTTALEMAAAGTPEWTVVAAGHQTAGRGRHGRTWIDRPGRALMYSVVLRPYRHPERIGLVSLAAGAAMAEVASEVSGLDVRCKWPNDLLVADAKVGGILAESEVAEGRVRHVVVGVGVNLEAPEDVAGAGALGPVDAEKLLTVFLRRFRELLNGHPSEIGARWRAISDTLGRHVQATTTRGELISGLAVDIDEDGALQLDTDAGRGRVAFGDIEHLETPPG
jgi:BirA family biotin operon repressor/biotin-[acetyl-CoA-carboxylase] ligase